MDVRAPESIAETLLTSLVLPTYNPGKRLDQTWDQLQHFLAHHRRPWEVLFVCDGCTDGTLDRLEQLTRTVSPGVGSPGSSVRVLAYQPNRGKGHAVRRGLEAARGAWRIFTDVDLAYPPADILAVAERLWQGADVVIGSRSHPESRVSLPPRLHGYAFRRHLQGLLFGWVVRRLLPLSHHDTQAGLKGFSASAVHRLLPHLVCNGFGFDCELLTACSRLGLTVTESPVCVRFDDDKSTTGLRSALLTLGELWRVRRSWRSMMLADKTPGPALDTSQRASAA
jgi:glycosyltransferase involved in cell wall biosynthesis